jgi:hypothetical protein
MVTRAVRPADIRLWLAKSWRVYKKRPFYLWVAFVLFALVTIFPSFMSPFGRIFAGFLLPLLVGGAFIFVHRVIRFKQATYDDLFFPFHETRLGMRLMPVSFVSLIFWTAIGAIEFMNRQTSVYHLNNQVGRGIYLTSVALNTVFLLGVTPILIFSSLNIIQATALAFRSVKQNFLVFAFTWGGGLLSYYLSQEWILPFIPVGAFLMVFWYVSFDGCFMIMENPLRHLAKPQVRRANPQESVQSSVSPSRDSVELPDQQGPKSEPRRQSLDYYDDRYKAYDEGPAPLEEEPFDDDLTEEIGEITETKTDTKRRRV